MATEEFDYQAGIDLDAAANVALGSAWFKDLPTPDPVSGGILRLWQFHKATFCTTEMLQPAHLVLAAVDSTKIVQLGSYSAVFYSGTSFNGLDGATEAVPQTNFVSFLNKDYAGNVAFMGNATSVALDLGFEAYMQTTLFDGVRFLSRGIAANDTIATFSKPRDKFLVASVSHTSTSRQALVHGVGSASRTSVAYVGSGRPVGVANKSFASTYSRGQEISSFAQADMAMTQVQLVAVSAWIASLDRARGVPMYAA